MLLEPEDLPAVDADALEDAVAVEQAVIEDGDFRGLAGVPLAVEPDGGLAGAGRGLGCARFSRRRCCCHDDVIRKKKGCLRLAEVTQD